MSILDVKEDPKENDKEDQVGKILNEVMKDESELSDRQSKEKMILLRSNCPYHSVLIFMKNKVSSEELGECVTTISTHQ